MKRALFVLSCVLAGCAVYRPKPLTVAAVEGALRPPPIGVLRILASQIRHPILRPVRLARGVTPDSAAIVAVLLNPTLRAERDRRGLAVAQLMQAGILPNPQLSYSKDFVTGGDTAGTVNAFGFGATWDITSLITLSSKIASARAGLRSVDLDIAWMEWQTAQAARAGLYRVVALQAETEAARDADRDLRNTANMLKTAVEQHQKTVLDLAAAEATSGDAHATALSLEQDFAKQMLALKAVIGLPPHAWLVLRPGLQLPSRLAAPPEEELLAGLEERRLDLLGLKQGYLSQEETVRAAVLAQFPKIGVGFNKASDTTNVHTTGFGITLDLPLFDRNQGNIATELATRQKLFDEYAARLFEARSDIATALADIRSLNEQIAAAREAAPVLDRLVKTAQTALLQGNGDVLSYYAARGNLIQKDIQILKLEEQLVEARTALELASGRYLPSP